MKANELRIGNLFYKIDRSNAVHIPVPIPMKIYGIELFEVEFLGIAVNPVQNNFFKCSLADVSPIKITPEWLNRLGFEKDSDGVFKFDWCFLQFVDGEATLSPGYAAKVNPSFKFVHQLQNLYFALTGEELTIHHSQLTTP